MGHVEFRFPTKDQIHALQWKCGVLTTKPPEKSPLISYFHLTPATVLGPDNAAAN